MKKLVYESLEELNEDWKSKIAKGLVGAAFMGSMAGLPACSSRTSDNYDKTEQTSKTNDKEWKHKSYQNVFNEISKHYYLKNTLKEGITSIYNINDLKTRRSIVYSAEDLNNIKNDIMKFLQTEPKLSHGKYGGDSLDWDTDKYSLSLMYETDPTQTGGAYISITVTEF